MKTALAIGFGNLRRLLASAMAVALGIALVGCSAAGRPIPPDASPLVTPITVPFGPANLNGLAWLPDGRIVFGYEALVNGLSTGSHLWTIEPDGRSPGPLALDIGTRCSRTETLAPLVLPNGGLSYQLRCFPGVKGQFTYRTALLAVASAGPSTPLMPLIDVPFIPRQAAWSPDLSQGLLGGGSEICEGIVRVSRNGFQPWSLQLGSGGSSFNLADFLAPGDDCVGTGNADLPAWSPDGQQVAFFGSPAAVGVADQSRLDVPWTLYLVGPTLSDPMPRLDGVIDPLWMGWEPNGHDLAFVGSVGGQNGAFLMSAATGQIVRFATAQTLLELAWSPDGTRIAGLTEAISPAGGVVGQIEIFDLKSLTK